MGKMIFVNIFYLICQCTGLYACYMMLESGATSICIVTFIIGPIVVGSMFVYGQFLIVKDFLISRLENAKGKEQFSKIYN
jgi:hypothetical protein